MFGGRGAWVGVLLMWWRVLGLIVSTQIEDLCL